MDLASYIVEKYMSEEDLEKILEEIFGNDRRTEF
jgi:hypothetical protein